MYTFARRKSAGQARASFKGGNAEARTATPAAAVQAQLDQTLNSSDRVASQQRLAGVLNQGPRAATQAKLMQMMSGPVPLPQASDGQGITDEEELLQTKPAVQRETMADDEDLMQPKAAPVQRDHMADDEDMVQPKLAAVQREGMTDDEDLLQQKSAIQRQAMPNDEDLVQPKLSPVQRRASNATGMPDGLKQGVEGLSGLSLDNVRVHYNSSKPAQMQALAYAQGTDIHLGPGQQQHLPHEAWHVVQQMEGRVPVLRQLAGQPLNDDPGLEGEADRMGQAAARFKAAAEPGDGAVAQRCGTDRRE